MNARHLVALVATALFSGAPTANAVCTFNAPSSSVLMTTGASGTLSRIPATWQRSSWLVSAVSPVAGEDWDMRLFQNTAADPACVANVLASSAVGGSVVDFIVGDMRKNPHADVYEQYTRYSGTGIGRMQWKDAGRAIESKGTTITSTWTSDSLFDSYEVHLYGGLEYTLQIVNPSGVAPTMFIFRNPGPGSFWSNRSAALATTTTSTSLTPDSTGDYLVVITNDTHASGSYQFRVGDCARYPLTSGIPRYEDWAYTSWWTYEHTSRWCAIGARSTAGGDYDLQSIDYFGGPYPGCTNLVHATSAYRRNTRVELVVADYDHYSPYYQTMQAHTDLYSGAAGVWMESDSGAVDLVPNGTSVSRTSAVNDVLETFNVSLVGGVTYNFYFPHTGADYHALLFRNTGIGEYYAGRSSALTDQTGSFTFTAPASDRYGLVVVNDDGAAGTYTLGVTVAPCVVPTSLYAGSAVTTVSPESWYEFTPTAAHWGLMATRGATTVDDWELYVSDQPTGTAWPGCIGPVIASSTYGAASVDVVALDFNTTPLATYYARSHHLSAGSTAGRAEWYQSHQVLQLNATPIYTGMASTDLAQMFEAWMVAGTSYMIDFVPDAAGLRALVFENSGTGSYVAGRTAAVGSGTAAFAYTPARTGYHAIAVVNDGIVTTGYYLRYGTCVTPTALASGVGQITPYALSTYTFQTTSRRWLGVGLRSVGTDWDLRVSTTAGTTFPNCIGSTLANSTYSTLPYVDFVVGNLGRTTIGSTYWVGAQQYTAGATDPVRVLYDASSGTMYPNEPQPGNWSMGAERLLRTFDIALKSTETYTITLERTNSANLHVLLFRNPASGAYWAGRSSALFDLPASTGTMTFTPPSTDTYGIVVTSEDGASCTFKLTFRNCTTPVVLADTTATYVTAMGLASFAQTAPYWTAVGVRSNGTDDYDFELYSSPTGGALGTCFSGLLARSIQSNPPVALDYVVGDFNSGANALGTYYARPARFSGSTYALLEWAQGHDAIAVGGEYVRGVTSATHALRVYDVYLTALSGYSMYFAPTGPAVLKATLFCNAAGGAYWVPRSSGMIESTTHAVFTAPVTGWYGLVISNENGLAGEYEVGFRPAGLDVDGPPPPAVTALRGVSPNPARGEWAVEYALHEGAHVRIDMLDMAGRRVATLEDQERGAGTWRAMWSGAHMTGGPVPPGLYFVRLQVAGRVVGERKVALVP